MPVNWTNIPISFQGGVDTKTDFKQVVPGKLQRLENGVFTSLKQIQKRNGYANIPLSLSAGKMLSFYQNELIALDGTSLYSYSQELGDATNKGLVTSAEVTLVSAVKDAFPQTGIDAAWSSTGLQLVTWTEVLDTTASSSYSIIDSITGDNIVYSSMLPTAALYPKPFVLGNFFIILYYQAGGSPSISYISIPLATPTSPNAPVVIATDFTGQPIFDASEITTRLFISWYNNTGSISLKYLDTSLTLSAERKYTGATNINYLTVWSDLVLSQVWVSYATTAPSVGYLVTDFNLSVAPVLSPTTIDATPGNPVSRIIGQASNGSGNVWYTPQSGIDPAVIKINTSPLNNLGTGISVSLFLQSLSLIAKVFTYNSVIYIPTGFLDLDRSGLQSTYFIISSTKQVVAKILPDTAGTIFSPITLPEVTSQITGKYLIPVAQTFELTTQSGVTKTQSGASLSFLNFLSNNTYYKTVVGENLEISGGTLSNYDGQNINEQNFHLYPTIIQASQSNTGGHLGNASVATNYAYIATYEWTDNQGQIHRSTTSIPNSSVSFSSGVVTGQVTITITTLPITQKTNVRVVIYRTAGNGTVFYQITSNLFLTSPPTTPLFNDPSVQTVTYVDSASDASIIGNAVLYTTGGVVDNASPSASFYITPYQDRLILFPSENKNQFFYTKNIVPNSPPEFSLDFTWNVDPRGGDLTGGQQLDDKFVLFKQNNIFYMVGQGPTDTGSQNDFTTAQLLPFDLGCNNAHSILSYPGGLVFQSNKGIWRLDRGLNPSYIGSDVETYNNNRITSASIVPNTTQLRFTLDSGVCLVYDYFVEQWSVFTNVNAQDSTIFQNLFTYIQPSGSTQQETIGSYTDNGSFIRLYLLTSWLSFAQLQGYSRMKRLLILGDWLSAHSLIVNIYYDFNSSSVQTTTLPAPITVSPYEWRLDLEQQKSTAIQFSLEDSQSISFEAGLSISNLNFMAGIKQGSNKLAPSRIYA